MSSASSSPNNSISANIIQSIQKPKNKRNILPKKSLIQLYIKNPETNTKYNTISPKNTSIPSKQFNKQFNFIRPGPFSIENFEYKPNTFQHNKEYSFTSTTSTFASSQNAKSVNTKKCTKEKKIQEITRMCLDQSNKHQQHLNLENVFKSDDESFSTHANGYTGENLFRKRQSLFLNHLAKEFFLDCRQRMEANSFRLLLNKLNDYTQQELKENQKSILDYIYDLIKDDQNLCNKFSAFLTCENSLSYDLQMQSIQYEKCFEFFNKLELFIPNKCTFKKLIHLIISSANFSTESDTCLNKIDEIKTKIKSMTKNNPLINFELDYMFDQRFANLEPTYEKITLINKETLNADKLSMDLFTVDELNSEIFKEKKELHSKIHRESSTSIAYDEEYINLTNEYPIDYGTKKCSCKCHILNETSLLKSDSNSNEQIAIQQQFGHCLLCSLKLIKGKLFIKCEGKKGVPLNYKIG